MSRRAGRCRKVQKGAERCREVQEVGRVYEGVGE
jgi:hypothetical protein